MMTPSALDALPGIAPVLAGAAAFPGKGMAALAAATFVAGLVNSVAGGGTILTFPVLAALLPAGPAGLVAANATSTLGLWPGAVSAAWASSGRRADTPGWTRALLPASVAGAVVGTLLVLVLPPAWFSRSVPWLILSAALLFAFQPVLARKAAVRGADDDGAPSPSALAAVAGAQFLVAVYGGYFGAGIGILMLAVLGWMGLGDIHRLNAVKNVLAAAVNGTTAAMFLAAAALPESAAPGTAGPGLVSWPHVAVMAVASAIGGVVGTRVAGRFPAPIVRRVVALIGFGLAGYYFANS